MANLVDIYIVYRVLRKLSTPFTEWPAFAAGVIDAEGNILKKSKDRRTVDEIDSFTPLDVMVLKLKRLLAKVPGGQTKFATYAAALLLIKEDKSLTEENVEQRFSEYMASEIINEDIANAVGTGNIAGTTGDPPKGSKVMMRRFAKNDVFVVNAEKFNQARFGKKKYHKYENYVGNDEVGDAIRVYGRKYPKKPIIIQDELTGAMTFLRHGRSGMFTEALIAPKNSPTSKEITQADLKSIENYADELFKAVGIDVAFTRHFLDRVNDARNITQITPMELTNMFRKSYLKHGKKIAELGPDAEAVINDMKSNINMPFVLKWDSNSQELDLVAKTVMRKKNFMTPDTKLSV
jgi:hypothetical protein